MSHLLLCSASDPALGRIAAEISANMAADSCAALAELRDVSELFFTVLSRLIHSGRVSLDQVLSLDYVELLGIVAQAPKEQQLSLLETTLR